MKRIKRICNIGKDYTAVFYDVTFAEAAKLAFEGYAAMNEWDLLIKRREGVEVTVNVRDDETGLTRDIKLRSRVVIEWTNPREGVDRI